ncbi:MAG: hypothetical protein GX448_11575 [Planctomycetes bacterium]|nr:hypothetical protein [Planctomycetota bacterium]
MLENEHNFRKIVAGLRTDDEPNPAHRERLRRQVATAFEQACARGDARPDVGGAGLKPAPARLSPAAWLAIAAAILVVAGVGAWRWLGSSASATGFERVRLATESAPWMLAVVTRYLGGEAPTERQWCNFANRQTYVLTDDETVVAYDYGRGQVKLAYSPKVKTLVISELPKTGPFGVESAYDFVQTFAAFAARADVPREESSVEYEGRTVRTHAIDANAPAYSIDGRPVARLRMTVLADPRTRRIVAAHVEHQGSRGNVLAREEWAMSYPASGPTSVYDLGVPRTARVFDTRQSYRGTPGDLSAALTPPPVSGGFRLEPLQIELPKAKFSGTPQDGRTPNLERPRGGPRPPFLAPAGTVNLARGKPVSSSDPEPIAGSLDLITDGDKEAFEGGVVELGPRPQFITIDLQESCEIYAVVLWHHHRWPRSYNDVVVQVSDDRSFKRGVRTIFNNDADNTLGLGAGRDLSYTETYEGKLIDAKSVHGRYVRCYSNGNTHDELNHYTEVEVYGTPARQ